MALQLIDYQHAENEFLQRTNEKVTQCRLSDSGHVQCWPCHMPIETH